MQEHLPLLENTQEGKDALLAGLQYLINISFVMDDEIFKITLDYWNYFVPEVYSRFQTSVVEMNGGFAGFSTSNGTDQNRKRFFADVLSQLRLLMISRMAKPEEVLLPLPLASGDSSTFLRRPKNPQDLVCVASFKHG